MSTHDAFAKKFREFLRDIPNDYTLEQWQFAYRQVMLFMGVTILEKFPNEAAHAMDPPVMRARKGAEPAGQGPHPPCGTLPFPAFVLEVQTPIDEPKE